MMQPLYLVSTQRGSVESQLVAALMEWLSQQQQPTNVFQPIAAIHPADPLPDRLARYYQLPPGQEQHYGCTLEEARELIASGRITDLLRRIVTRFKQLEQQGGRILCTGIDLGSCSSALELDLNADLASALGCKTIVVIEAHKSDLVSIEDALLYSLAALRRRRCQLSATIISQVPANCIEALKVRLDARPERQLTPIYAVPVHRETATPADNRPAQAIARVQSGSEHVEPKTAVSSGEYLGLLEAHVDLDSLLRDDASCPPAKITPLVFEYELLRRARSRRRHIVLPESSDERILQAVDILLKTDAVDLTLLGNRQQVTARACALGLAIERASIVDPSDSVWRVEFADCYQALREHKGISGQKALATITEPNYFATMMVYKGYAHGMVSGAAHTTADTIRPAFEIIKASTVSALVSSVFFMCLPDQILVYGDCAINPQPDSRELAEIAIASAATAISCGLSPKIAMLSYSTGDSGKGVEVDKVRQAVDIARRRCPELEIEGPLQYDAAIDPAVAAIKLPESTLAGQANVFIFPDLNAGNNTYKAVQRAADILAIGPILQGLNKPVNDLSRGCSVADIVNTVAITAIQAQ